MSSANWRNRIFPVRAPALKVVLVDPIKEFKLLSLASIFCFTRQIILSIFLVEQRFLASHAQKDFPDDIVFSDKSPSTLYDFYLE